jgi:hypothetical protein
MQMQVRNFHCETCDHVFPSWTVEGIAEEILLANCPLCRVAVGLYRAAKPVLDKPSEKWTFGDVLLLAVVGYVGYKALSA